MGGVDPIRALAWIEAVALALAVAMDVLLVSMDPSAAAVNRHWYPLTAVCVLLCSAAMFSVPHAPNRRYVAVATAFLTLGLLGWLPPDGLVPYVLAAILCARLTFAFGSGGAIFAWLAAVASLLLRLYSGAAGPDHAAGASGPRNFAEAILYVGPFTLLLGLIFGMIALMKLYAARSADSAAADERSRIALDLHDFLGHGLTTLRVQLQNAERHRATEPEKADEYVRRAAASSGELLADIRETVQLLHETANNAPSFSLLFDRLCSEFSANYPTEIEARNELEREPTGRVAIALYRLLEEALMNVARHARATRVVMTLRSDGEAIEARVEDDGCGFDQSLRRHGHGLLSMRERMASVGGRVTVDAGPDRGTTIFAVIPLEAAR